MNTTLNEIRKHNPCVEGWTKLLKHLSKTAADDEPLPILTIMDSNGLDDALWCLRAVTGHEREIRLYAVWCARQVQHLMTDERSIAALQVAEDFANGVATAELVWCVSRHDLIPYKNEATIRSLRVFAIRHVGDDGRMAVAFARMGVGLQHKPVSPVFPASDGFRLFIGFAVFEFNGDDVLPLKVNNTLKL